MGVLLLDVKVLFVLVRDMSVLVHVLCVNVLVRVLDMSVLVHVLLMRYNVLVQSFISTSFFRLPDLRCSLFSVI